MVPIIPNLDFFKDDFGSYNFDSDFAKLMNNEDACEISNINIKINNDISSTFVVSTKNFVKYFEEENTFFPSVNKLNIETTWGIYSIHISNFIMNDASIGPISCLISGKAKKIKFIKYDSINENDKVNVWNVLDFEGISQPDFCKFNHPNLHDIFLKSINTFDFYSDKSFWCNINNCLKKRQKFSFNQLIGDNSAYLFYKSKNNCFKTDISYIENLSMFYSSNINPIRMKIFEEIDSKKLEIIISSKNISNIRGYSIFSDYDFNFFKFINSSYARYIEHKNGKIDIDLLLHYYVWLKNEQYYEVKLILASEFMEVLKKDATKSYVSKQKDLYKELKKQFNFLKLDCVKLLRYLQPEVYDLLDKLKNQLKLKGFDQHDVNIVINNFKKTYLLSIIVFYRNKILHSGDFNVENSNIDEFINKKWVPRFKSGLCDRQKQIVDLVNSDLCVHMININSLYDISNQSQCLEYLVEIILLILLDVDCDLGNYDRFRIMCNEGNGLNSKEYVSNFLRRASNESKNN